MMVYLLITKNKDLFGKITIDESAKEEFKKLLGWDEEQFQKNTVKFS